MAVIVVDAITGNAELKALLAMLSRGTTPVAANGLWGSAAPIVAGLAGRLLDRPLLYLTAHPDQADDARDDIETVLSGVADLLPAWESLPGEGAAADEISAERTRLCSCLLHDEMNADSRILAPIQALIQPVPTPKSLEANTLSLAVGESRDPEEIITFLTDHGFERLDQVEEPGDFAVRGGILDIFATADVDPVRIEFFGDQIDSIRQFEVGTQRSARSLESTQLALPPDPASAKANDTTNFLKYLPPQTLVILDDPVEIAEVAKTILDRLGNPIGHYPFKAIVRQLAGFSQLHLSRFPQGSVSDENTFRLGFDAAPSFEPKALDATGQLVAMGREQQVVVYCDNHGEEERLQELIEQVLSGESEGDDGAEDSGTNEGNIRPTDQPSPRIETRIGLIHHGFCWTPQQPSQGSTTTRATALSVLPHHELFHRYAQKRRIRKVAASRPIESFIDLSDGDYVVHVVHGIAKYVGMKTMRKGESHKSEEFLTLRFAEDATIHVPASQIDLVQKYVGAKGVRPILSKLGGTRWQTTKAKVEAAVTDLASDLLRIQAVREGRPGIPYPQDTHWQVEFENAFPYTETPDQVTTLRDIKKDMTGGRPMDRLLCGDVGYGKTELAMRAAFKVIEYGKQVAVLVPTTVLAEQHYRTFTERIADYPFVVERLTRFRSTREIRETVSAAKKGHVDILIGTHRLLSKDVDFSDLGLVIVDEEQRFGVEHKEQLKRLRATVEVLTMTATPIPRTLHMAMIGLRDISSLATPPMDRRAINTRVSAWNDQQIRDAIVRELNRDGQVYFVHNRVKSIKRIAARIGSLVPDARIVIGHGQMHGDELEDVMARFIRHEADILVCTSIIEAGLDIPNANTMFIDRADWFGLADLHQLRGRVGRYKHRAYCYLLISPDRPLTDIAAKRLKAIEKFSDLGAGFRIAMRDLEIRGAGNILGPEQSGHIAAVGYELYCQLLEKSVKRMRGEPPKNRVAVHLELDIEAYLPKSYIQSDRQRMECYRRVVACHAQEDVKQLTKDLLDAFGKFPETVDNLLTLAEIKVSASQWNIQAIIKKEPDLIFHIDGGIQKIEPLFAGRGGSVRIPDGKTLHWRLPDNYFFGKTLLRILRNIVCEGPAKNDGRAEKRPGRRNTPRGQLRSLPAKEPPPTPRNKKDKSEDRDSATPTNETPDEGKSGNQPRTRTRSSTLQATKNVYPSDLPKRKRPRKKRRQ